MSYYFWLGRDAEDINEYELACHAMHSAALGHEDDGFITVVGLAKPIAGGDGELDLPNAAIKTDGVWTCMFSGRRLNKYQEIK